MCVSLCTIRLLDTYMARYMFFSFFFFKQKTAYEILRDWSSDVCSSDLGPGRHLGEIRLERLHALSMHGGQRVVTLLPVPALGQGEEVAHDQGPVLGQDAFREIGRASCRERG